MTNKSFKWALFSKFSQSALIALFAINALVAPAAFGAPDEPKNSTVEQTQILIEAQQPSSQVAPSTSQTTSAAATAPRYVYVMSQPLALDAELGKTATFMHYAYKLVPAVINSIALFHFGGIETAAGYAAVKAVRMSHPIFLGDSFDIRWQSYVDLKIRSMFQKWQAKKALAKVPTIKSYALVLSQNVTTKFALSKKLENQGFLIFETAAPLSATDLEGYRFDSLGMPLLVSDPERTVLRLELNLNGQKKGQSIDVSVLEILGGEKIASAELQNWRGSVREFLKGRTVGDKLHGFFVDPNWADAMSIKGSFVTPEGKVTEIGEVYQAKAVASILEIKLGNRLADGIRTALPFVKNPPPLTEVKFDGLKIKTFDCGSGIKLDN